jgi:hypothetical protein
MGEAKQTILFALGAVILAACILIAFERIEAEPLTFTQAKTLSATELGKRLIGGRIGSKVIEAIRHERNGVPAYTELFTQPELTQPRLNGVCRTDVITVEYNWEDSPDASALLIARVEALPRYKSFTVPPGEPGTPENNRAQAAACAGMGTASDAFRAPSAGDAQWLAAIESEFASVSAKFAFTCSDFADTSCVRARQALRQLKLGPKTEVKGVDCPKEKTGDQINLCYRLSFPYSGKDEYSDRIDMRDSENYAPEWVVTVFAGMRDGFASVRIRSLSMEHRRPPIVMY